jgi:CBS domain-containing protein
VLSHDLPVVDADMRIPQFVSHYLLRSSAAIFPVARDNRLVGIITADDIQSLERNLWGVTCVGAIAKMPEQDHVVQDDADAWAAFTQMLESDHTRLLVMHEDRFEGDISRESVVRLADLNSRRGLAA